MTDAGVEPPVIAIASNAAELLRHYGFAPQGVRANMIFSIDAAAAVAGRVQGLTSPTDQHLLGHLRSYADVILVGAGTARAENYGPARYKGSSNPPRIAVVSLSGDLPARLYDASEPLPILITSAAAAAANALSTDDRRQVLVAGDRCVDIASAVRLLQQAGMRRILCEGGPTLLDEIVRADLLDEICVTIAPRLAGAQPIGNPPLQLLTLPLDMRLCHVVIHEGYVFLRYARSN